MENETNDVLELRARCFLRDQIGSALEKAQAEVSQMLRRTNGANTDHAYNLDRFAEALIYDVVMDRRRPTYITSGSLGSSECPSFNEIARNLAHHAAKAALDALASGHSATGDEHGNR